MILAVVLLFVHAVCAYDDDALKRDVVSQKDIITSLPDKWLKLVSSGAETGSKYELFGCVLERAKDGCKHTFLPKESTCQDKLSISRLFEYYYKGVKLKNVTRDMMPWSTMDIERFVVDGCDAEVDLEASAKESFDMLKRKLKVENGKVNFNFNFKELNDRMTIESFGIDLAGDVNMQERTVPVSLNKRRKSNEAKFSLKIGSISGADFAAVFSKRALVDDAVPDQAKSFASTVVGDPTITGTRSADGSFEVVLRGVVNGVSGLGELPYYVVVQKPNDGPTAVCVLGDLFNIQATKVLSSLVGKDLSNIPVIDNVLINAVVEFSSGDIVQLKDAKVNKVLAKYVAYGKTVAQGTKIKIDLPTKKILANLDTAPVNLKQIPDSIVVQVFLYEKHISFLFPDNAPMDLANIAQALIPKLPEVAFNKVLKASPKITIPQFDVNIDTKAVILKANAAHELILGSDLISLKKAVFEIKHHPEGPWTFDMRAEKKIAEQTMEVEVHKSKDTFYFEGKLNSFTTRQLANNFGASDATVDTLQKYQFADFDLKDVDITTEFDGKSQLHIRATPLFFDYDEAAFEAYILGAPDSRKMAIALVMRKLKLSTLLEQIFNKKVLQINWMQDLTASLTISNGDILGNVNFTVIRSRIRKGIYISTVVTVPDDCRNEQLCELAKDKMTPGTKLFMDGEITSEGFVMQANYKGTGLHFGKNFVLEDVYLLVKIDATSTEFSIRGRMTLAVPKLDFKGKLFVGETGKVELLLTLGNYWQRPFGLKYAAFNRVQTDMGVSPGVPIMKVVMAADLYIGKIGSGQELVTQARIGYNPVNALENFFYGEIPSLTMQKLVKAFEWKVDLPEVLKDTRFPDGLVVGFTLNPKGKKISHLKSELKGGLTFSGTIDILRVKAKCDIYVTKTMIKVDVEFPILLVNGGMLKLKKSAFDRENGPTLSAAISPNNSGVRIQTYAELLGIGKDVAIDVSNKGIRFHVFGSMFNMIEANVTVVSPYKMGDIINSKYVVTSCFASSLLDITVETANLITNAGAETARALKESQEKVRESVSWFAKASSKTQQWVLRMSEKQLALQRKSEKLDLIDGYLETPCTSKCKMVCVGGPSTLQKCKQILKVWVTCPKWDKCKKKVKDTLCLAKCKAKKVLLESKSNRKRVAMEILLDSIGMIKKILALVKEFVMRSKGLTKVAEKASQKIEEATNAGKQAMYAVAKFTKKKLVEINHICFDTSLRKAEQSCFDLNVDLTIGRKKRFQLKTPACLDVSYVKHIARAISEQLFPGITAIKEKVTRAREYFEEVKKRKEDLEAYTKDADEKEREIEGRIETTNDEEDDTSNDNLNDDDLSDKSDADKKKNAEASEAKSKGILEKKRKKLKKILSTLKAKTGNAHTRDNVPMGTYRTEKYIHQQIYGYSPSVTIRDDVTLDSFESESAWAFAQDDSPFTQILNNKLEEANELAGRNDSIEHVFKEDVPPLDTDMLEDQDDPNKCSQTKGLVSNYAVVSDAVSLLLSKLKEEKEQFSAEAKQMLVKTKLAEDDILHNCAQSNITTTRQDDALYYINKLKNGTAKWIKNVEHQVEIQDKESLRMWRRSFADIIKSNKGMDVQKFLDTLKMATEAAKKRHGIPTNTKDVVLPHLKSASRIVSELLAGEDAPLTERRSSIEKLNKNVAYLRKKIPCAA